MPIHSAIQPSPVYFLLRERMRQKRISGSSLPVAMLDELMLYRLHNEAEGDYLRLTYPMFRLCGEIESRQTLKVITDTDGKTLSCGLLWDGGDSVGYDSLRSLCDIIRTQCFALFNSVTQGLKAVNSALGQAEANDCTTGRINTVTGGSDAS